jgi:DNA polymerase III gamma/tau subunit
MSLFNKHRPQNFDGVIGNEATIDILRSFLNGNRATMHRTFLFTGPSGCGKSTLAEVLAHSLVSNPDAFNLTKIDASHSRGKDDAIRIRNKIYHQGFGGNTQVYIFEEAHQWTSDAQNVLLKPFEEPPAWAILIMCTTEPESLLPTIRNRCMSFEVERLTHTQIVSLLQDICTKKHKTIPVENLKLIADKVYGCPRQAIVELERIINLDHNKLKALIGIKQITNRSDIFKKFISQCCDEVKGSSEPFGILYKASKVWYTKHGHKPEASKGFSQLFKDHGYKSNDHATIHLPDGKTKQRKVMLGLKLK